MEDHHRCKLEIGHKGELYSQRNTYTWADGRVEVHDFPGYFTKGRIVIDSQDVLGYALEMAADNGHVAPMKRGGADTILFYAGYRPGSHRAGADVWDLIRLTSPDKRFRTWQIQAGGRVVRLCEVAETRTSAANVFLGDMHEKTPAAPPVVPTTAAPTTTTTTPPTPTDAKAKAVSPLLVMQPWEKQLWEDHCGTWVSHYVVRNAGGEVPYLTADPA